VNYTLDDPFNGRDAQRFRRYLKAVPYYDLLALVREENPSEATLLGARNVMQIWRSADEVAHRPRQLTADERTRYASDVCFIGTWMPERGPFMADLIKRGIPLAIWGDRWNKAPEWPLIAPHWRGPGVYADADYAGIIQSARISLGLLSKGNRDLHTQRSLEIPSLGGLLCAERTAEHLALYDEGKEAVFWQDAEECAEVCNRLLKNETLRLEIAQRGLERARRNNHFNEPVIATVIEQAMSVFGVMR
jgi:spore maturation protein CgeB